MAVSSPRRWGNLRVHEKVPEGAEDNFDKGETYVSARHGEPVLGLNGKAIRDGVRLNCAELASDYLDQGNRGEVDLSRYASVESMIANVCQDVQLKFLDFARNNYPRHIGECDEFGKCLRELFVTMPVPGRKRCMVNSSGHAMGMLLETKTSDNGPAYVAHFFDPNVPTIEVRCEKRNSADFATQRMSDYFLDQRLYRLAFPVGREVVRVTDCSAVPALEATRVQGAGGVPPTAAAATLLLTCGAMRDAEEVLSRMQRLDLDSVTAILTDSPGGSGQKLGDAILEFGTRESLKRWMELLKRLTSGGTSRYVSLALSALPASTQRCSLINAMVDGDSVRVKSWARVVSVFPGLQQRIQLWLADDPYGTPAIVKGMRNGQHAAVRAWVRGAVRLFPTIEEEIEEADVRTRNLGLIAELLVSRDADGVSALQAAMASAAKGAPKAVRMWGSGLSRLTPDDCARLLIGKTRLARDAETANKGAACIALGTGRAELIDAWGELLQYVAKADVARVLHEAALDGNGRHAFFDALAAGRTDAARSWLQLVAYVSKKDNRRAAFIAQLDTMLPVDFDGSARQRYEELVAPYREQKAT